MQDNTDCKFFIDSSNPNVIKKALKVYKGVPLINSINYETDINLFNEYEMYSPAYIFMEIKEGIINEICRNPLPVKLNKHNILVDCCVEPLDINPNAFNELSDRIKNVPEEYQIILGISNLSHHFLDRKGIDTNAYALLKNRCIFIANTQNVLYNDSMINILYNTPTDKKLMDVKDYIVNGVIPNDETIKSFLDKDSIEVIEKKILDALNFIGEQFEARKITTYELQAAAKVTKILLNKYFPTDLNNSKPEIIIATVKGDFHDIGKTIVCSLMSAHKISFIDLGVNVSIDSISQTLIKYPSIKIVALSGLIYPSVDEAKNDIEYIHKNFESVEVYVGGAVFNNAIAKDINADGYFSTALESVNYFAKLLNK
ncbi:hypothetical protein FACS189459_0420 [Bacilli bacterium]|nr:hypothetical protein FACS189459_0420 [Bacilli bacterium]